MFQFVYLLSSLLPSLVPPQIPSFLPPLSLFLFAIIKQYYDEHLAALLTFSSIFWWSWSWNSGSKMYKSSWFALRVAFLESSLMAQRLGFWVFSDGPGFNSWLGNWDPASCMTQPKKQNKTKQEWSSRRFSDLERSLANDEWKYFFPCIFANTGIVFLLIFTSLIDYFNLHFLDYSEHLPYAYLPLFFL